MDLLRLPDVSSQIKVDPEKNTIFDSFRKKFVALTPEEWVRQHFLHYLVQYLNYPAGLISVEMALQYNKLSRRCDIVVFTRNGAPKMIIECKAPKVKIAQKAFDQVAAYNLKLKVDFLVVTNGLNHFCCKMDYTNNSYTFIEEIPDYSLLAEN
ncbi:MAG: type I restriction enzyme HsdR N-terminal domain-containing protein [Salinivirgaceae bacterium]